MWPSEICLQLKNVVRVTADQQERCNNGCSSEENPEITPTIGGFLRNGSLAWRSKKSCLEIFCTTSGEKQLSYSFDCDVKTKNCTICNVEEMQVEESCSCLIAVGIQLENGQGMIIVLTVEGSRILGRIDINEQLSCLQPVSKATYIRGRISAFDGCLAIGTTSGKVLLVDACLKYDEDSIFGHRLTMNNLQRNQCHIEFSTVDEEQISTNHSHVRQRGSYFGLQLETMVEEQNPVITILDLPSLMAIAVGYANGQMVLYDLIDLHIIHIACPPQEDTPIISMNLLEPTDDPKACVYIWAFHAGGDGAFAVMHTLMYEEKYVEPNGHVYERFISCSPRMNITSYDKGSFPVGIQSIMKTVSQEEEVLTLCVLSWIASDKSTNILVFDLNQWYKAEMPFHCDWRHELNHTVVFNVKDSATNVFLVTDSLIPFSSIHRPEEHFYPNSMSFDILALNNDNCARYHWTGLQNKILENFEQNGSNFLMEPTRIYTIMLRAALVPQFIDCNVSSDALQDTQREFLLSVALEYNCYTLLQQCAISWADGSHLGENPEEGVSLSTLTDWAWNRAKALKDLSNSMCVPLFDLSGRRIDCGTQKTLLHCARQLRQLSKLYDTIFDQCKQYVPDKIYKNLSSQAKSVQLAADYQEVVQWLLNVGLLPEGNIDGVNLSEEFLLVPFPYQAIRSYYASQRTMLHDKRPEKSHPQSMEEQSCKYLFIDNFIDREFPAESLRKVWIENNASGVYPPNSVQNVVRALLIPNISTEIKYVLLCYTFMDMTAVLGEGRYGAIVQNLIKFPAVFKLNSALIKRTQAFWLLDHGNINGAIEELLSPMSQTEQYPHWQREFLITALLRYDAPHLALRALRTPGMPISPFLELKTLLENNLISEAFKLQRSKHDTNLLRCFYEGTLKSSKYEVLLDLALSEEETRILREYLIRTSQPMAENVHFIHLLQKLDFVEAVHMVDKLEKKRSNEFSLEAPKEALTLYHAALEPTTQHLTYLAYVEQKELKPPKAAVIEPLSSRLIRGRADFRGRIYHKSIVAIKEAAEPLEHSQPFLEKPGLGIFQFRTQTKSSNVCYPIKLDIKVSKRKNDDNELCTSEKIISNVFSHYENPAKRRKINPEMPYSTSFVVPKRLLTEFRPMKPSFNFSSKNAESASEKSLSRSPSAQLTTPLVRKMQLYNPPSPESVSSYTPHGILKSTASVQSFVNRKSLSPVAIVAATQHVSESDEKILRFDLPESPLVARNQSDFIEPLRTLRSDILNDSLLSNDVFFSPEGSFVAMEDDSCMDIKGILSSVPKSRPSIHSRSCSTTPVENNIAIIIEDVDDDSSNKELPQEINEDMIEAEVEESILHEQEQVIPIPDLENRTRSNRLPLGRLVLEANARRALEVACSHTIDGDVLPVETSEQYCQTGSESVNENDGIADTREVDILPSVRDHEGNDAESHNSADNGDIISSECKALQPDDPVIIVDEEGEDIEMVESDQESSEESTAESGSNKCNEEEIDVSQEQVEIYSDCEEVDEDEVEISDASITADVKDSVINILSSSDSEDIENDGKGVEDENIDDDPIEAHQVAPNVGEETGERIMVSAGPSAEVNTHYADFYSDTVPELLLEQQEPEKKTNIEESTEAHVSTTTSSTSNMESAKEARQAEVTHREASPGSSNEASNEGTKDHQAEDLTIQQEAALQAEIRETTPEPSSSRARRNLSMAGNERSEQSSVSGEIVLVSPTREESFNLNKDDKFLGKPKNAHEVEIPAMNLSVKPDEAHEANRKNSKSDESDDAAVLNLSTGQIAESLRNDDQNSELETVEDNNPSDENRPYQPLDTMEDTSAGAASTENSENKSVHSQEGIKEAGAKLQNDIPNPVIAVVAKLSNDDNDLQRTPRKTRRRSADSGEASTSTPRSNVRTRRMSAMEKIEEYQATPTKRSTRASSVALDSPSTPLGKIKRFSSMTKLATPESVTVTPRRCTRALSLAKELLTSTPRTSEIESDTNETKNVISEETDDSIVDDNKSEKSALSTTSSRRSTRRQSSVLKSSQQSMISEKPVKAASPKPLTSSSKFEEESFVAYTTNRRLTRHQTAIVEKSLGMGRKMCSLSEHTGHVVSQEEHESESDSVASNISNTSKRSTRSKASQQSRAKSQNNRGKQKSRNASVRSTRSSISKRDGSDTESIDTDHSASPAKKPMLETISEEGDESVTTARRRGRSRKN
ncbi:protein ELYS [Topomyia yanbarensis]|uniref:protein ELYS n=1 Tax=Topomyia yanbarensis TaxID=2498891 RepID=UPI00273B9F4E|nr:protein ELYS [Topomyia yanbarensis]